MTATLKSEPTKQQTSVSYRVENMSCESCAMSAEKFLNLQLGVLDAKISFPEKTARIEYNNDATNPQVLKEALSSSLGYDLIID